MGLKRKPPLDNLRRVRSTGQHLCRVITNKAGHPVRTPLAPILFCLFAVNSTKVQWVIV